jgi:hypothetical protein
MTAGLNEYRRTPDGGIGQEVRHAVVNEGKVSYVD